MFDFGNDYDFMEGIDAFPAYIYKTKFDFKFNSFKEKVDEYLKESKRLSTKYNWGDPEHGDAITGVHFNNMSDTWDVPHNWDEFDKFNEYLNDPNNPKWELIANQGRKHALENLNNDKAVTSLVELMEEILK